MPIYTYQIIHEDGSEGDIVELVHGMDEPPLTEHPETGERVVRVFNPPHIAGWSHERKAKELTSDKNLERHGFTKYVRNGKGHYERHAGNAGPSELSVD